MNNVENTTYYDKYPFWEANKGVLIGSLKNNEKFMGLTYPEEITGKIIDIGCGSGRCLEYLELAGKTDLTGIDNSKVSIENARRKLKYSKLHVMDATDLSFFEDESFDVIICHGVAHHTSDPVKVLEECKRICKKSGMILFSYYKKYSFYYWDYKFLKNIMRKFLEKKNYAFMKLWMLIAKQATGLTDEQAERRFADRYTPIADFKTKKELTNLIAEKHLAIKDRITGNKGNMMAFKLTK